MTTENDKSSQYQSSLYLGVLALAVTSFMGATSYGLAKALMRDFNPTELLFFRFLTGSLTLVLFKPTLFSALLKRENLKVISSALSLSFSMIFLWKGVQISETGLAAFLANSEFILIPIIGYFLFGQTVSRLTLLLVIIGAIGVSLLCITSDLSISLGTFYLLLSALGFSFYAIFTTALTKKIPKLELSFLNLFLSAVFCFPVAATEGLKLNFAWDNLPLLVYLGPIMTGIRFYFITYGQSKVRVSHTGLIYLCEPIGATIIGYYFLGEIFSLRQIIGAAILILTVIGSVFVIREEEGKES